MARFLVLAAFGAAVSSAAPSGILTGHALGGAAIAGPAVGLVGAAPAVIGGHTAFAAGPTHVQEHVHAGPAVAKTHVQHGVVGHRTVQAGSRTIQVGHQYNVAGSSVHQPAAYQVVERPASQHVNTVPIPVPAAPVPAPYAAIPPPARNLGPAPADKVINEPVLGLGRQHTIITPQRTQVVPQLNVNKYQVDVPVPVAVPVEKTVIVEKPVSRPYQVDVPVPVRVEKPYPVHHVKHIVETPVVEKRTYTHVQPVAVTKTVGVAHVAHAAAPAVAVGGVAAHGLVGGVAAHGLVGGHGVTLNSGLGLAGHGLVGGIAGHGLVGAGHGLVAGAWPAAAWAGVAAEE